MSAGRKRTRGQAMTEFALIMPMLVFLMLGATDLGRAFYLGIEMTGSARAGLRQGVINASTDVGNAARSEPNSAIANTQAIWGDTGPGGANDCDTTQSTHKCGDPLGCIPPIFNTPSRLACFAVRTCTNTAGTITCPAGSWQSRPASAADGTNALQVLDVRVVYKFTPATPLIAGFTQGQGSFYLIFDQYGLELY
jgi:Flp pilus assembly protein TadG